MKIELEINKIKEFSKEYNSNNDNKNIENSIVKKGIEKTCINNNVLIENQPIFNIELLEGKKYNQQQSSMCWIFAGFNLIRYNIANNLNINIKNVNLSNNYISFFDKLEKSNNVYENIINSKNTDLDYLKNEKFIDYCVTEAGYWEWFVAIVEKYGLIPYKCYPDVYENQNTFNINSLYIEKVKKDILELIELKKNNTDINILRAKKELYLKNNYEFLSKILGEPPLEFSYEYKDKNDKNIILNKITPIEFKNKFLTLNLKEFVNIGNMPMYNKKYYTLYRQKYLGNVYGNSTVKYLNLPINDLKTLSIKQLNDGLPVYFGSYVFKCRNLKSGILDTRLYNYSDILNFKKLFKKEALNLNDINMHHCMVFTGVNIINNKPQRWKVEDSFGCNNELNGNYVMNDNFFNEFVFNVIINKKYLSKEQIEMLNQESIDFDLNDPF